MKYKVDLIWLDINWKKPHYLSFGAGRLFSILYLMFMRVENLHKSNWFAAIS